MYSHTRAAHPDYSIVEDETFYERRTPTSVKPYRTTQQPVQQAAPAVPRRRATTAPQPRRKAARRFNILVYIGGAVFIVFFILLGVYLGNIVPAALPFIRP